MSIQSFFERHYVFLSDMNKLFLMEAGFKFENMETIQWDGTFCRITTKDGGTINLVGNEEAV